MEDFEELAKEYGTVTFNDEVLALTQDAYCDTDFSLYDQPAAYFAYAIDEEGNEYKIKWEIINEDTEDEGDKCDWENPIQIRKLSSSRALSKRGP